jgi:membrane fusion protein, multidrug efflux system
MKSRLLCLLLGMAALYQNCSRTSADATMAQKPVKVLAVKAASVHEAEVFSYSGTIEESQSTPLSFSVIGKVARVLVAEGDYVRRGQLLAELSSDSYQNTHEMTQAALKQAEDAYNRLYPMYQNGNLPEVKLVEVQTGLQQAKAAAAIAQRNLEDCRLHAPVSGYIGKRSIEPGMSIIPGLSAVTIVKIDKVYAKIPVSENEIVSIQKGQPAAIQVGALGDRTFSGAVAEIGVLADPIAHTYRVRIAIPNQDKLIKPGMICSVILRSAAEHNGVTVPNQAVQVDEKGGTFIFSIDPGLSRALRKYVKTGRLFKNGIEIKQGVSEGEWVVIAGQQKLVDQTLVELIDQSVLEGTRHE